MFTLGQVFWIREDRSDFECKVVGVKQARFLKSKDDFDDYLIEKKRLNSYHESFENDRTNSETFRLDISTNKLTYWYTQYWPGTVEEWRSIDKRTIKVKKPKDLRSGPYG